jgi:hypothetical protein
MVPTERCGPCGLTVTGLTEQYDLDLDLEGGCAAENHVVTCLPPATETQWAEMQLCLFTCELILLC